MRRKGEEEGREKDEEEGREKGEEEGREKGEEGERENEWHSGYARKQFASSGEQNY